MNSQIKNPLYVSLFSVYYLVLLPNCFTFVIYQSRTVVKEKKNHCSLIAFLFKDSNLEQNVIRTLSFSINWYLCFHEYRITLHWLIWVEIICKQLDFLITYLIILEITNWQILIILKDYETSFLYTPRSCYKLLFW